MSKGLLAVVLIAGFVAPAAAGDGGLEIYLPRQAVIDGETVELGDIAVIQGDEQLFRRAEKVRLGRLTVAGQKLVIDRPTLLSRLACSNELSGADCKVTLSGAERITVRRKAKVISPEQLIETARASLGSDLPSGCRWELIRRPQELVIPGVAGAVKLQGLPEVRRSRSGGRARVQVIALADANSVASAEVGFRMVYQCKQAVAKGDIAAGDVITEANCRVETTDSVSPSRSWRPPFGLVARRGIRSGQVIDEGDVRPVRPPQVIERGQAIVIRLQLGGLAVSAGGQSLDDGRVGEIIKVRNTDSHRIIVVEVQDDGTVRPVL